MIIFEYTNVDRTEATVVVTREADRDAAQQMLADACWSATWTDESHATAVRGGHERA